MNRLIVVAVVALLVLGLSDSAFAGTVKLSDSGVGTTNGGEFIATVQSAFAGLSAGDQFGTFCTEKNEYINYSRTYDVVIATWAWNGGNNTNSGDPLDFMTAYLYTQYRAGTLEDADGNDFDGTSDDDVDDLQKAIWYIEQEDYDSSTQSEVWDGTKAGFDDGGNGYLEKAFDAVHGSTPTWTDGIGDVRIMQLWYNGTLAQDQLMLVPLPSAAYLGLALLGGMMFVRRIRRKRSF